MLDLLLRLTKKLRNHTYRPANGQGLVEYALLLGLIAVVAIVAISSAGNAVKDVFNDISSDMRQTSQGYSSVPITPGATTTSGGATTPASPSTPTALPSTNTPFVPTATATRTPLPPTPTPVPTPTPTTCTKRKC